jgi:PBP4 family serine-type D-alanyl-D-alanine carboxypeptidase
VENRTLTVEGRLQGRGSVGFSHGWDGRSVRVSGEYPINEPAYDVRVSVPDGNLYAAHALEQALHQAGIRLDGRPRVSQRPVEVLPGAALARVESPPLSEWVGLILRESENWYAEMLLRALALEKKGEGRLDAGLGLEREFLEQVVGVPGDAFFLDDASGLSPYNLLAPEAVVALLRYVLRQPWRGLFLEALARPGEGTLERWPKGLAVRAKTGTIQHTLSLAGYIEGVSGEPVVFALFLNHWPGPRPQARAELQALVRDWVRCTSSSAQACRTRMPEGRAETLPRGEAQAGGRE